VIELRPTDVFAGVQPKPKILLPDHWVKFSNQFPDSLNHVKGRVARISKQQQVPYKLSYTLKGGCYYDLDLSNETGEKLYPYETNHLYELLIGFKPGNYMVQVYFPSGYPVYRLDYTTMTVDLNDSELKYLGAIDPEDSPDTNPILKFYLVYKLTPIIFRLIVLEGTDYEKMTLNFLVNRCLMDFSTPMPSNITPKPILYLSEIAELRAG
jgi:hypothetical protein